MSSSSIIDLRSDTVTKPSPEMLDAMFHAAVGDDVFNEDPSILELEKKSAELFGKEAALFVPSGTMANQIAIKVLTNPQEEVICDKLSHIYYYESGGVAFNSGTSMRLVDGDRGELHLNKSLTISMTRMQYICRRLHLYRLKTRATKAVAAITH